MVSEHQDVRIQGFRALWSAGLSSLGFEIQLFTALDAVRVKSSGLHAFGIPGLGLRINGLRPALQGSLQFHGSGSHVVFQVAIAAPEQLGCTSRACGAWDGLIRVQV